MDVNFQRQNTNKQVVMSIEVENQQPVTLEAIEIVSPTSSQLAEYIGDYYSDELQVTYKLTVEEGKLLIKNKSMPILSLAPLGKDKFDVGVGGASLSFIRDSQNRVVGFQLDAGRVTDIHFVKKLSG